MLRWCRWFKNDVELLRTMRCDIHGRYRLSHDNESTGFRHLFLSFYFILLIVSLMLYSWTFYTRKLESARRYNHQLPLPPLTPTSPQSLISIPTLFDSTHHPVPRECQFRHCLLYFTAALLCRVSYLRQCCLVHSRFDVKHAIYEQLCFMVNSSSDSK